MTKETEATKRLSDNSLLVVIHLVYCSTRSVDSAVLHHEIFFPSISLFIQYLFILRKVMNSSSMLNIHKSLNSSNERLLQK